MPFDLASLTNAREISRDGGRLLVEVSFPAGTAEWGRLDMVARLGARRPQR